MITSNSIYDMLTRIKNGILAKKLFVFIPNIKLNLKILNIIYKENFIKHYTLTNNNEIKVFLKYNNNNISFIKSLKFFPLQKNSTFLSISKLWKFDLLDKLVILSTSKGFLTGKMSIKKKIGGKLICIIE
jgi:small subunit ribosomal protein S8